MPRPAADNSPFHAIADPTRRAVLELLRDREIGVSEMLEEVNAAGLSMSQSGLSQHLAVLRRAGLVSAEQRGRRRFYAVSPAPLREIADWISYFDRFWTGKLRSLGSYLDQKWGDGGGTVSPASRAVPAPPARARRRAQTSRSARKSSRGADA